MSRISLARRLTLAFCLLAAGPLAAQIRLPAIDPTGNRIFSGSTTTLTHDLLHCPLLEKHRDQEVAPVSAPGPAAPPCAPPPAAPIAIQPVIPVNPLPVVAPAQHAQCADGPPRITINEPPCQDPPGPELKITPSRIVAPVNTEVILAAGICGPTGYYIMRQPLEWMLAQDGVGQFVAVGHESPGDVSLLLRHSPNKIATNYARAHTSTISQVLTRGTANPSDDVCLQRGQSWITVTSPTEGASHVVVWAPKEHNWDRRRATATIYWVDAAWQFPPGVTAKAGSRQILTTTVRRANGEPVSGWTVRYEIAGGPSASFSARGETAIEVRTDAAGRATAELLPRSMEAGITSIRVQVIRPGSSRGESPQMVVGQGLTTVQWTTPGLSVRAIGTSAVMADGAIAYRVEVTNSGDLPTRGVSLSYTPPPGVNILNSTPTPQIFGQRYEWRLGDLPPRTTSTVELNCRASVSASVRSCFRATSSEQLTAEGCATTEVRTTSLAIKMTGPETMEVGREARFLVDVTNTGQTPLTNLTASDTFDPGLAHVGGERSPLVRSLVPVLDPGQTHRFALALIVTQPGRQCHRLDVTADGGQVASTRACLTGTQPVASPPQLSLRVNGPPTQRVGEIAVFQVDLVNSGSSPADNINLSVTWGANLGLDQASRDHEDDLARQTTRWRIASLPGGQTATRILHFRCLNPDSQGALVRATVTSQQTTATSAQAATIINPGINQAPGFPRQPDPVRPAPAPAPAGPSGLKISAAPLSNPIPVGAITTVVINVTNSRQASERDVSLNVQVSGDGLSIARIPGSPTTVLRSSSDAVEFAPVREMRGGEQLATPYRIEVRGLKPGRHRLLITANSASAAPPAAGEAEVTVNAP